jgi:hypothetical protein
MDKHYTHLTWKRLRFTKQTELLCYHLTKQIVTRFQQNTQKKSPERNLFPFDYLLLKIIISL